MNYPTPSIGSVPGLTAAGHGLSNGVPLFTPPQTPSQHGSGAVARTISATSSVAGVKREGTAPAEGEDGNEGKEKRRRIAPTPVTES